MDPNMQLRIQEYNVPMTFRLKVLFIPISLWCFRQGHYYIWDTVGLLCSNNYSTNIYTDIY